MVDNVALTLQRSDHVGEDPTAATGSRAEASVSERVLSRMRADIFLLKLAPGEAIAERSLERSYGASRTPIREALGQLIREGLIVRTSRGYAVAPFDMDELEESFEYRELLEDAAVRLACRRAEPQALDALQETVDRGLTEFTPQSWFEIGLDVHVRLAELSGNRFLREAVQDVISRTMRIRWLVANTPEGRSAAHREHSEILRLVRARDAEAAATALRQHGRDVRRQAYAALEESRRYLGARSFVGTSLGGD
jgi:DNA-binding GntR family transcriptional regulator